jgi:integrase
MAGKIRTLQKCPKCGDAFKDTEHGLVCSGCLTTPTRYFIDIYWKGQRLKIYSDRDGHPLDSYRRAQRLIEAMRHEIDEKRFDPQSYVKSRLRTYRFGQYLDLWLSEHERRVGQGRVAPSYLKLLKSYARTHFLPFFKEMDIREIRSADIKIFADSLPELSLKSQSNILGTLRKIFNDAFEDGYVKEIPKVPKVDEPEIYRSWLDEETQDAILEKIPEWHRPIILFMMRQGVRPGATRALQWRDIDLTNGTVVIRRAFSLNVCREFTKTKHIRVLPLDPDVRDVLLSLPTPMDDRDFVFKYKRRPYSESMARKVWNRATEKLGIKITLYEGTRHSVASQAVNRGVDHRIVGKFLGHQNPKQTERYAHVMTETLKTVLRQEDRPQTVRKGKNGPAKVLNLKEKRE